MVQSLQLLPAAYTYTPKICLRFARPDPMPDPHRVMLCTWAALLRMRVQSATANSHHHLTPRLPHTCPAAPDRAPRGRARLSQHRSRRPRFAAPHRAPPTSSHPVPTHRQCSRWGRRCCSPKPAPQTCFAPHTLQRGTRPAWRPQPPWSPHSSGHALGQLQTALSPTRGRKRPAPLSTGKSSTTAHCLSPEGALACSTRRALGY